MATKKDGFNGLPVVREHDASSHYRRNGSTTQAAAVAAVRKKVAVAEADEWEKLMSASAPQANSDDFSVLKLGSFSKTRYGASRAGLRTQQSIPTTAAAPKAGCKMLDKFDSLSLSRSPSPTGSSPSSTSSYNSLPKVSANPYDFEVDEEEPVEERRDKFSQTSSGVSSLSSSAANSQQSSSSVGSTVSLFDDDVPIFRRPLPPVSKSSSAASALQRGLTFPPSKKRPANTPAAAGPAKKLSPEKPITTSRGVYHHRWSDESVAEEVQPSTSKGLVADAEKNSADTTIYEQPETAEDENGKIKCKKNQKNYFVVVQHVRNAIECYDNGEVDECKDEIAFLLGNLSVDGNNLTTRCLSAINLATKLLDPGFRVHFFAHASTSIFEVMKDANDHPNLRLCLAGVVFVLSTDTLKMDIDVNGLQLLANILEQGSGDAAKVDKRILDGVVGVVAKSKLAAEVPKENVTAPRLILEALMAMKLGSFLSVFLEQIRTQGILEYFVKHLIALVPIFKKKPNKLTCAPIQRVMDFFYKVMHDNKENSVYLVSNYQSTGYKTLVKLARFCYDQLKLKKHAADFKLQLSILLRSILTVVLNVTGHAELWRGMMGAEPLLMETLIKCCFELTDVIPNDKAQEILIRSLLCLVNLVFNCETNCKLLMNVAEVSSTQRTKPILAFVELIKATNEAAANSGDDLDRCTEKYDRMIRRVEPDADVTITDVLDKAGENMEHFAIMCYIGLMFGQLIMLNEEARTRLSGDLRKVFGSTAEGLNVAMNAIKRLVEFVTDAKAEKIHPIHEMHAAVDALEMYGFNQQE